MSRPRLPVEVPDVPRNLVVAVLRRWPRDAEAARILGISEASARRLREVLVPEGR